MLQNQCGFGATVLQWPNLNGQLYETGSRRQSFPPLKSSIDWKGQKSFALDCKPNLLHLSILFKLALFESGLVGALGERIQNCYLL